MTDASKPTTYAEFGVRHASGSIRWPDEDNELHIPGYGSRGYVAADDMAAIRKAVAAVEGQTPLTIVQRTVTKAATVYSEAVPVPDPLPTAPGSVVEASVMGAGPGVYGLTDDRRNGQDWIRMCGEGNLRWFEAKQLTNVTVLFDAGTIVVDAMPADSEQEPVVPPGFPF